MPLRSVLLILASSLAGWCAPPACAPASTIRTELQRAAGAAISDPYDFDGNVAPFLRLRERYPDDLFVHEQYQDAVFRFGIEGHLVALAEEYQRLSVQHFGELHYRYLNARSQVGRNTISSIQGLNQILAETPDFAPAHRTLTEIYASAAFRDVNREGAERQKLMALCPGSLLVARPGVLPAPSPLVDQAEQLLASGGDPDRINDMAVQGIRDDEWRLQRIRPFDWYSVEYKRQALRDLQVKYWKVWSIQVRCQRKARRPDKVAELLAAMEERSARVSRNQDSSYWDVLVTLASLYLDGNQYKQALDKLAQMRQFLAGHPDPGRLARLEDLQKLLAETKTKM